MGSLLNFYRAGVRFWEAAGFCRDSRPRRADDDPFGGSRSLMGELRRAVGITEDYLGCRVSQGDWPLINLVIIQGPISSRAPY
jgi:hypothetical protein